MVSVVCGGWLFLLLEIGSLFLFSLLYHNTSKTKGFSSSFVKQVNQVKQVYCWHCVLRMRVHRFVIIMNDLSNVIGVKFAILLCLKV